MQSPALAAAGDSAGGEHSRPQGLPIEEGLLGLGRAGAEAELQRGQGPVG